MESRTDAQAIIDAIRELSGTTVLEGVHESIEGKVAVVPEGQELVDLRPMIDQYKEAPSRMKGFSRHSRLSSFIEHGRFMLEAIGDSDLPAFLPVELALYADEKACTMTAYYGHGAPGRETFNDYGARYCVELSDEWKVWSAAFAANELSQTALAELIEDRLPDIVDPSQVGATTKGLIEALGIRCAGPAGMAQVAKGIAVNAETKVKSSANLSTGEVQFSFEETHRTGDESVKIPGGFVIAIPVFRDGAHYQIPVRLRYRLRNGVLTWKLVAPRAEESKRAAFDDAVTAYVEAIKCPVFYGALSAT